ncbi:MULTISPECIES: glutaredoxin 3 [Cysteiniphilum]|uniref:Glutaredoxin n=1 Tax=Cysteiniphilum litorale TaxID=2056700 RepID=A0A8J3E8N3_9GAMM|nr:MULTISPECIES: glutaredoxin 3 [Cysteiniphilum]GGF94646.1 glutaredoxin 3 [Cysteiniphilum litorale]
MIEIYTKPTCPYCINAKALLNKKGVTFTEYNISDKPQLREEMIKRAGRTSVPQIFIDNQHIGGCDDLYALEDANKLNPLLGK